MLCNRVVACSREDVKRRHFGYQPRSIAMKLFPSSLAFVACGSFFLAMSAYGQEPVGPEFMAPPSRVSASLAA